MPRSFGLVIIAIGVGVALLGLLIWTGALSWFGRLPGDIRIERPGLRVFVPITSMVILSAAISLLAFVLRKIMRG